MAELNPPQYEQQRTDHPANGDRLVLEALIGLPGVGAQDELDVTANSTPNMTVHVAAGSVFIDGTEQSTQGFYHCYNDGDVILSIAASNPTNPRIDLVVARVKDAFYSGGTNAWDLEVVQGTPAASPVPPTAPANTFVLAQVLVGANVTSITNGNITQLNSVARAVGAPGMFAAAAGQATNINGTAVAIGGNVQVAVTFPSGRFSVTPRVQCTITNTPSGSAGLVCRANAVTATGMQIWILNVGTAAATWSGLTVDWFAQQMLSNAASG